IIPLLTFLCGISSIFIPYVIGVSNGHVPSVIPFISDCGALAPENCIFTQLLNMTALLLIISIYLRHRQIVEYYGNRLRRPDLWWRKISFGLLIIGFIAAFFITATAAFPITENVKVHIVCAMASFLLVTVYIWGQVILSFSVSPRMSGPFLNWIRLLLALIGTGTLVLYIVACYTNTFLPDGYSIPPLPIPYTPEFIGADSPYWLRHTVAAGAEWAMVISNFVFVLTMSFDLRHTYVRPPKVFFKKTHLRRPRSAYEHALNDDTHID
ncbi:hypothetical protein PFISCL1PPCAC_13722, partial [Pristionchus fissidentatus]